MLICGATNISLLNSMGQHFHSLLSNKRVLNKEDKNLLTKDFSIPVNICYHLFFSLLRFPQSSSALPCPHTDSHIPHSPEQAGQDPRLRFSLCCLLRTWLQWKSGEVRLQKAIEPLPLSRWLHPCGNLWSGDQQTHVPIFCIPGYRFQRGGGTWATKQNDSLHQHPYTLLRDRQPLLHLSPHSDSHHSLSLWRETNKQSNRGTQSCSALSTTCTRVQKSEPALGWRERLLLPLRPFICVMIRLAWNLFYCQGPALSASCFPLPPWCWFCQDHTCAPKYLAYVVWGARTLHLAPHILYNPRKSPTRPTAWLIRKASATPTWRPSSLVVQKTKTKNQKVNQFI